MIGKIFKLCQLYVVNDYQTYMYLPFFISIKRYLQVPDISKDMLYFAGCGQHLPVNAKVWVNRLYYIFKRKNVKHF